MITIVLNENSPTWGYPKSLPKSSGTISEFLFVVVGHIAGGEAGRLESPPPLSPKFLKLITDWEITDPNIQAATNSHLSGYYWSCNNFF